MWMLHLLSAALLAQVPEPVKFTHAGKEYSYRYAPAKGDAILFVLPVQPENPATEWSTWSQIAAVRNWHIVMPASAAGGDAGVRILDAMVEDVRKRAELPKAAIYLLGAGPMTPMVIYAAARSPHTWTAALAIGGSPKAAIDTDRLFSANISLLPIAWAVTPDEKAAESASFDRLVTAGFRIERLESPTIIQATDFLAKNKHNPFPTKVDCETGNPAMARCYWVQPIDFDPALRNDALRSTRVPPDTPASLEFGGFGYKSDAPGPGILIEWLPDGYKGPLQLKDKIMALSGKTILDPKHYQELMSQVNEEKPVAVTIERAKERIRLVTRYQLRKREEVVTARVQAEYFPDNKEILIVTRSVATMRVTVPPQWAPAMINWNGQQAASPHNAGCYQLSLKEGGASRPCTQ